MDPIIKINNLNYVINKKKILHNINMSISQGSIIGIIGTSSSGKTTLLKMIAGLLPNRNSIVFNYSYLNLKKRDYNCVNIGTNFTDYTFIFDNVYDELIFPLENLCYDKELIELTIKNLVDTFDCAYILDKRIDDLNSNEKSIVRLLLSIIHKPKLLVLDNPFKSMGYGLRDKYVAKLFKYIKDNGITAVIASSNTEDILYTDCCYVIDNGEIIIEGNTLDVLKEDVNLKKVGIDLPFMVDLSLMYKFYEILDDIYLDMKEMVNKLWN